MIREIQNQIQIIKHLRKDTLQTIALGEGNSVVRERDTVVPPAPPPIGGFTFPVSAASHAPEADDPLDMMILTYVQTVSSILMLRHSPYVIPSHPHLIMRAFYHCTSSQKEEA